MRLGMARRPISPKTSSTSVPNRHHDGGTIPLHRQSPQKRNPSLQSSRGLNQPSRWLSNFLTARIDDAAGFLMDVPPPAQGASSDKLECADHISHPMRLLLQTLGCCRRFFDQRGVLLCHLIELRY